jgi:quinol monooxygenase YgiN
VLVVTRYRASEAEARAFLQDAETALAVLAARNGFLRGHVGRSTDDPQLWVLSTEWENVGAYRRALSSYEVKMHAVPVMYRAIDEPSAYEVLASAPADSNSPGGSRRAADAGTVGLGQASAPHVPSDLD